MARTIPQRAVETDRLRLRPFVLPDAPTVQLLAGSREVASTTLNVPHPYEDGMAEAWIATHAPGYEEGDQATFAIVRGGDDQLIGAIGLSINQAHVRGELGYWIGVPFWNRGYVTEAARAVLRFGFEELELNRIYAVHLVRNPASGRVMQKVGMRHEGTFRQHLLKWGTFEDVAQYGLLVTDWREQQGLHRS
jgi:ribosomal-protein-alanine N-acetyltransferase